MVSQAKSAILVLCGPLQYQFSCQCTDPFQHVQTCTHTSKALSAHFCGPIHPSFCMHASLFHSYSLRALNHASILRHSLTHGPSHIPMLLHSPSIVWPYYTPIHTIIILLFIPILYSDSDSDVVSHSGTQLGQFFSQIPLSCQFTVQSLAAFLPYLPLHSHS